MSVITELQSKYNALDGREQNILILGIVVVTIFLTVTLIYNPLSHSIQTLEEKNQKNAALLKSMRQSVAQLKASSGSTNANLRRGRSLNVIINNTASSSQINISRSQPRDNQRYQIWLDKVSFKNLLQWLNLLQKDYGIRVNTINLSTLDTSGSDSQGQVRVNLTFQDSGS